MRYKFQKHIKIAAAIAMLTTVLLSCSKWDDFKKYKEDGEILYTGKIDSVKINPGNLRVQFNGLLKADPKITKIKIFWNNFADSVAYDINMATNNREFSKIFPMEEGIKSFVIYTYDSDGNRSIAVNAVGNVYGPRYNNTLNNRIASSAGNVNGTTTIEWLPIDASAGPFTTEIRYQSTTGEKVVRVPVTAERSTLNDLATSAKSLSYRTLYLPMKTAIDTFYTNYTQINVTKDVTSEFLVNTKVPFATTVKGDRWGNPTSWITNTAVRNFRQTEGVFYGGVDAWFGGPQLAMEAGWSTDNMASIVNGKIYQSPTLPAGQYTFEMDIPDCTAGGDFYTVAVEGEEIPNTENVTSSLAYAKTNSIGTHKITFTITSPKKVSLGFVGNVPNKGGGDGTFWRIKEVRLKQLLLVP